MRLTYEAGRLQEMLFFFSNPCRKLDCFHLAHRSGEGAGWSRSCPVGAGRVSGRSPGSGGEAGGAPRGCWAPGSQPCRRWASGRDPGHVGSRASQVRGTFPMSGPCSCRKWPLERRRPRARRAGSPVRLRSGTAPALGLPGVAHALGSPLVAAVAWKPRDRWVRGPPVLRSRRGGVLRATAGARGPRRPAGSSGCSAGCSRGPRIAEKVVLEAAPGGEVGSWWEAGRRGTPGSVPSKVWRSQSQVHGSARCF